MRKNLFILICLFFALCKINSAQDNLVYKDTKFPFSISYPKDWKEVEKSHPQVRLEVISQSGDGTANFNISVTEVKGSENVSSANYVKLFLKDNPELINAIAKKLLSDAKVISSGKTYLSNQEAFFVIFEGSYKTLDEITYVKLYQLQMLYEGRIYTLAFGALKEEFDTYFPTFKTIASSFGVLPTKVVIPPKGNSKKIKKN